MNSTSTTPRVPYSTAYLFNLAIEMIDKGVCSLNVHSYLVHNLKVDPETATRITSAAFDPSGF